jgi:hypothetical protein
MATSKQLPLQPQLPNPDQPDYNQALNRALFEALRTIAAKLVELERRIKALEP